MSRKFSTLRTLLLGSALCCLASPAFAANDNDDAELQELLELSLEELTVSIASKRDEKIREAPGVMTVVSADEIRRYGARNLRDVLDRQPNMQVVGSTAFSHNATFIRGGGLTHADNTNLLLLNGRPIRESMGGGINTDIYRNFPIETIKRIEIIRGPGSILYGTNAFNGAINIVTKKANNSNRQMSVGYGSFNSKSVSVSGGSEHEDVSAYGGINYLNSDGWNWTATDEASTTSTIKHENSGYEAVMTANYGGLAINSIIGNNFVRNIGGRFIFHDGIMGLERQFIDVGYTHDWNGRWNSSVNATYNGVTLDFPFAQGAKSNEFDSRGYLLEATTHGKIGDNANIVFGTVFDQLQGKLGSNAQGYSTWRSNTYLQADYQATDWLKLIGGLEQNKPEGLDLDISFRAGAIINFDKNWGSKVLYGQAFRTAFGADSFINVPSLIGNSALGPETITTLDLQLFYNAPKYSAAVTYYNSSIEDVHVRVGGPPATFANGGNVDTQGIELEGKARITKKLSLIGSATYHVSEDGAGEDDVQFSPNLMIKTGLSYDSEDGYSTSIFNSHFGDASSISGAAQVNPPADSYNLLTANVILDIPKLFKQSNMPPTTFSLYGDNLLDENVFFPNFNRTAINSLPHHSGRAVYGTVTVKF